MTYAFLVVKSSFTEAYYSINNLYFITRNAWIVLHTKIVITYYKVKLQHSNSYSNKENFLLYELH